MSNPVVSFLVLVLLLGRADGVLASAGCGEQEMSPAQFEQILSENSGADYLVLDVRSGEDFLVGTIPGAINIGQLQEIIADDAHLDVDNKPVLVVNANGLPNESLGKWITRLCNEDVEVWILQGGIQNWRAQGLVLENPMERLTVPGTVPFVIPRGLCEMNAPAQEYN
jgi:thiosulfate/3-mercaptopyruvate sulfurtransferase